MREIMLFVHFIGLAMGLGTSFAHLFLGIASSKMEPAEAAKFRIQTSVISRMGYIGITLLIVSGIFLMSPYWNVLFNTPLRMLKLIAVILLTVFILFIHQLGERIKKGDQSLAGKIQTMGKLTFITSLLIVVLAVIVFR